MLHFCLKSIYWFCSASFINEHELTIRETPYFCFIYCLRWILKFQHFRQIQHRSARSICTEYSFANFFIAIYRAILLFFKILKLLSFILSSSFCNQQHKSCASSVYISFLILITNLE